MDWVIGQKEGHKLLHRLGHRPCGRRVIRGVRYEAY